eukprot:CAMPEP_0203947754 /NCGR_PEP_ID=MMETSP0359-20131031/82616_1 /ASSEMBLY_ACC=CAM_ASM_000338 /TAXON_ID=268821 /ORGANISM="Scrippsiella Hangoei, Strain SHTV-5" /LENGTH=30 /DNA_ID= /DNA_START= /DNA_END= /DNA_ORIENTATION=
MGDATSAVLTGASESRRPTPHSSGPSPRML